MSKCIGKESSASIFEVRIHMSPRYSTWQGVGMRQKENHQLPVHLFSLFICLYEAGKYYLFELISLFDKCAGLALVGLGALHIVAIQADSSLSPHWPESWVEPTLKTRLGKVGICLWQHCQSPESWSCSPCSWATPHSSNLLSHNQCHQLHLSRGNESYLCLWDSHNQVCLHCHEPWASSKLVYEQTLPSAPFPIFTATVPEPQASTPLYHQFWPQR